MRTRISVLAALMVAITLSVLQPGLATAMPSEQAVTTSERKIVVEVTPQYAGFNVAAAGPLVTVLHRHQ
jgi:hypothetical protein